MSGHAPSAVPGRCVVCRTVGRVRRVCLECLPTRPDGFDQSRLSGGPLIIVAAPGTRPGENPIDAIVRMHEEERSA